MEKEVLRELLPTSNTSNQQNTQNNTEYNNFSYMDESFFRKIEADDDNLLDD
jgi:hypothetical protein